MSYSLYSIPENEFPCTWGGDPITGPHIFKIGDIVRLILLRLDGGFAKHYFAITKIESETFHGRAVEIYNEFDPFC